MKRTIRRLLAVLLSASVLVSSLPAAARVADTPADLARQRVELLLVENGVQASDARARAAALTDDEALRVAAEFDRLPAGGFVQVIPALVMAGVMVIKVAVMGIVALAQLLGSIAK